MNSIALDILVHVCFCFCYFFDEQINFFFRHIPRLKLLSLNVVLCLTLLLFPNCSVVLHPQEHLAFSFLLASQVEVNIFHYSLNLNFPDH